MVTGCCSNIAYNSQSDPKEALGHLTLGNCIHNLIAELCFVSTWCFCLAVWGFIFIFLNINKLVKRTDCWTWLVMESGCGYLFNDFSWGTNMFCVFREERWWWKRRSNRNSKEDHTSQRYHSHKQLDLQTFSAFRDQIMKKPARGDFKKKKGLNCSTHLT